MAQQLTAEQAKAIWRYDPETGYLFYLKNEKRAGSFDGKYYRLQYHGKYYKASRVAWLMMTGSWPENQIDHINGDKLDDRFSNLRQATNAENCRNRKTRSNNISGYKGVSVRKPGYVSTIMIDGETYYLGYFSKIEDAKTAYDVAAVKLHGEFAKI